MGGPFPTYSPAGDSGILVTFGETIDPQINRRVHALAQRLEAIDWNESGESRIESCNSQPWHRPPHLPWVHTCPGRTLAPGAHLPRAQVPGSAGEYRGVPGSAGDSDFCPKSPDAAEAATTSPDHPQSDIRNTCTCARCKCPKFFTIPGYAALLVRYDPLVMDYAAALERVQREAEQTALAPLPEPRWVEVPVHYGGEHGPDLEDVARHCGLTPEEVVRLHAAGEYPVYFIGFTPGFPYLGGMDPRLATPRLATPRGRVPAGSVGIAGPQTGIYSIDSPGGWRIIGWTPLRLFDPGANPPARLHPGDLVTFRRVS